MAKLDLEHIDNFAAGRHAHQKRRYGEPYITHCRKVGLIARQIAKDLGLSDQEQDECQAAGLLHDTIEDTNTDFEDIERQSNRNVAFIVATVSDDKRQPSEDRHRNYVIQLKHSQLHEQIVKLADLYDNATDSFDLLGQTPPPIPFLRRWVGKAFDYLNVLARVTDAPQYAEVREKLERLRTVVHQAELQVKTEPV